MGRHTNRDFLSGPVIRTLYFHCRGLGSIPGWGAKIRKTSRPKKKKKKRKRKRNTAKCSWPSLTRHMPWVAFLGKGMICSISCSQSASERGAGDVGRSVGLQLLNRVVFARLWFQPPSLHLPTLPVPSIHLRSFSSFASSPNVASSFCFISIL